MPASKAPNQSTWLDSLKKIYIIYLIVFTVFAIYMYAQLLINDADISKLEVSQELVVFMNKIFFFSCLAVGLDALYKVLVQ